MNRVVTLATAWGPKLGGINSFNFDLTCALARVGADRILVTCVVNEANTAEKVDAHLRGVTLIPLGVSPEYELQGRDVDRALDLIPQPETVDWWIGHDIITGDLAAELADRFPRGKAALFHHMSYRTYFAYLNGSTQATRLKYEQQARVLGRAAVVFAIGPTLRDSAKLLQSRTPIMVVPGLAAIEPLGDPPRPFTGIVYGRLDSHHERIKQGLLAIGGFAAACRMARENPSDRGLSLLRDGPPQLIAVGILSQPLQEDRLRAVVESYADGVIGCQAMPYEEDRGVLFRELRRSSVAMMLSWHEGFGLAGWEAIAAGVPLIASRNSGLYRLLEEWLGPAGTACVRSVYVAGSEGRRNRQFFKGADIAAVAAAVTDISRDESTARRAAASLRRTLLETHRCTWSSTAEQVLEALHVSGPAKATSASMPTQTDDIDPLYRLRKAHVQAVAIPAEVRIGFADSIRNWWSVLTGERRTVEDLFGFLADADLTTGDISVDDQDSIGLFKTWLMMYFARGRGVSYARRIGVPDMNKDLCSIGGPVDQLYTRYGMGYEYDGKQWTGALPYVFPLVPPLLHPTKIRRLYRGQEWESRAWYISGKCEHWPDLDRDRVLLNDFLLLSVVPNTFTDRARRSGRKHLIVAPAHGLAQQAVSGLMQDKHVLGDLMAMRRQFEYLQAVIEVKGRRSATSVEPSGTFVVKDVVGLRDVDFARIKPFEYWAPAAT